MAVAGIGGFADLHHLALSKLEEENAVHVVAACDPALEALAAQCEAHRFGSRGVAAYKDFETMLALHARELDAIAISSPIPFHREHHSMSVGLGLACYLEKPPTLDPEELEDMIATDLPAAQPTAVGFNHISQPWRLRLKERVLAGEFGRIVEVGFSGFWRRPIGYFARNGWAGKLMFGDKILLDSCCGNAMSHYLHNMLFHAGTGGLWDWAHPVEVAAELYRSNDIESPDTIFARGTLEGGTQFRIAATHACETRLRQREIIRCAEALIEIPEDGCGTISRRGEIIERFPAASLPPPDLLRENLREYLAFLAGERSRPSSTLADCRAFVSLNARLYLASSCIHRIDDAHLSLLAADDFGGITLIIPGIEQTCEDFMTDGMLPSERGSAWAREGSARPFSGEIAPDLLRQQISRLQACAREAPPRHLDKIRKA
ncbi:MAG: hypothetical protein BGO12_05825 [Verrucomicrobia bacterium 61-8]|nr:MAG: hypothetical protein BGO12_05825 [Verrucomicrobia bacterium 61-8]